MVHLPPATLGGLAKYVARNDAEPKDGDGNINLNLIELDITEVPEEPMRERRAMPAVLPYLFILIGRRAATSARYAPRPRASGSVEPPKSATACSENDAEPRATGSSST